MDGTKRRSRCGKEKPIAAFSLRSSVPPRPTSRCRQCVSELGTLRYRRKHPLRRRTSKLSACQWEQVRQHQRLACAFCQAEKPLEEFQTRRSNGKEYLNRACRACQREREAKWRQDNQRRLWERAVRYKCPQYGMTPQRYWQMLAEQDHLCALCRRPLSLKWQTIDHDHKTGAVRGIVHRACNLVIGNAGEDIEVLHRATEYLQRHQDARQITAFSEYVPPQAA